jgi:hypothetical protein
MSYLRITAADKNITLVSENTEIIIYTTPYTTTNSILSQGRITRVDYAGTSVTSIPQYTGTNILYEYGRLSDHGELQVIFSNR